MRTKGKAQTGSQNNPFVCRVKFAVLPLLLLGSPAWMLGQAKLEAAHSLLAQLWHDRMAAHSPESRERIMKEVNSFLPREQQLIEEGILDDLNQTQEPSAQQLEERLRHTLTSTNETQTGSAAVVTAAGAEGTLYVVVYAVPWCAVCSFSSMDVFGPIGGHYKLLARVDDPLPNRSVALLSLGPKAHGEFRFLVQGTNWGDPHERLTVIVYAFDDYRVTSIWSRANLPDGEVRVVKGTVVLTFHARVDTPGRPPSKIRTEVYRVTGEGVQLERTSKRAPQ